MFKSNDNISNNLPHPAINDKKIIITGIAMVVIIIVGLAFLLPRRTDESGDVKDRPGELAKKNRSINFERSISRTARKSEKTELPVVDQTELKAQYQKNLKNILSELNQKIQTAGGIARLDILTIQKIKGKAMKEVVPGEYKDLHIDLIFALDLAIEGKFVEAENKLKEINNIIVQNSNVKV